MKRRLSLALAGVAVAASVGVLTAPAAGADPLQPHEVASPFGSLRICANIPIGPVNVSICI